MNTTLSWIKAYVPDLTCTAQEYTDAMTLSGTKVEGQKGTDRVVLRRLGENTFLTVGLRCRRDLIVGR